MKSIECHYKDGCLIFCTKQAYSYNTAHKILDIFHVAGLISTIRADSGDLFNVTGRLSVNYDPFGSGSNKWSNVISELTKTKDALEHEVRDL